MPAGNNRLLLVGVASTNNNGASSVSYAGRSLTRLAAQVDTSSDNRMEMWYLASPPVGSSSVSVQMNSRDDLVVGAANYRGVNQSAPFGIVRGAGGRGGTAACVTLANEPAPLVVSFVAADGDADGLSPSGGLARQFYGVSDDFLIGASDVYASGAAGPSVPVGNVCQTLKSSRRWAALAVPLRPAFIR